MERNINNQHNDFAFNLKKSFVGLNLITAYHSIINVPYCNPLIHDPNWNQLYFVFFVIKGSIKFITKEKEIIVKENQILFGETDNNVYLLDDGNEAEFISFHFQLFNYSLHLWKPYNIVKTNKEMTELMNDLSIDFVYLDKKEWNTFKTIIMDNNKTNAEKDMFKVNLLNALNNK